MSNIVVVPEMSVRIVTGETVYRYEAGFSAIYAEVTTSDIGLIARLQSAKSSNETVTVRCAMVDVIGSVTRMQRTAEECHFVIPVLDLIYRRPKNSN